MKTNAFAGVGSWQLEFMFPPKLLEGKSWKNEWSKTLLGLKLLFKEKSLEETGFSRNLFLVVVDPTSTCGLLFLGMSATHHPQHANSIVMQF